MVCKLVGIIFILQFGLLNVSVGSPWATPEQEALDELHDAEIFKAVVSSMAQWYSRHNVHIRQKRAETSQACYGDLGCFEATGPFSYLEFVPSSPEEVGTRFFLYPGRRSGERGKRNSITGPAPLDVPADDTETVWKWAGEGGFNTSNPTKVIVHGFGSSCSHVWVYEMRSALMAVEECNIICVDWENGALIPNYVRASANTRLVGAQLAQLLKGLNDKVGLPIDRMHLIGFSLGAHVAGFAGQQLGGNISRITGLDPAGPLFESQDPRARLDSTDAKFVDVIHSNGETLILGGLGSWQPMGHVDFYPNGGRMQKGCSNLFVGAVSDIIWSSDVEGRSLCNHRRAYKFFTDSVSPRCHFPAFPCESYDDFITGKCFPCSKERKCGNMGYYADRSRGQGQLYLITRDEEPFCAHQYEVRIDSTPSDSHVVSYGKIMITLVGETDINETFIMTQKDDEKLILGESLSKIVVPHPVLGEPMKVELTYIAYSGWLSSGLARWKIDKISLYDSFGKSSSVCQKGLDLETGVPVVLPLYPGECNPPKNNDSSNNKFKSSDIESNQTDDNSWDVSNSSYNEFGFYTRSSLSKFVPTPVVHIGNEAIHNSTHVSTDRKDDIVGDTWTPIGDLNEGGNRNSLDGSFEEKEVSRALNTRAVKIIKTQSHGKNNDQSSIIEKEILEPILKPNSPSNKNSRSHKLYNSEHDSELSEPLLGPTTSRSLSSSTRTYTNTFKFSDFADESDWTPTSNTNYRKKSSDVEKDQKFSASSKEYVNRPTIRLNKETKTRNTNERNFDTYGNDNSNVIRDEIIIKNEPPKEEQPGLVSITVQLLPQRLASMLEQAERYARMTLWPLISVHTPKILTDFVSSLTETTPKYMPLHFEEPEISTTSERDVNKSDVNRVNDIKSLDLNSSELDTFTTDAVQSERRISLSDESTELFENLFSDELNQTESIESIESLFSDIINSTLSETFDIDFNKGEVLFENKTLSNTTQEPIVDSYLSSKPLNLGEIYLNETSTEKQSNRTKVYITLPVYEPDPGIQNMTELKDLDENNTRKIKYIPLKYDDKKIDG